STTFRCIECEDISRVARGPPVHRARGYAKGVGAAGLAGCLRNTVRAERSGASHGVEVPKPLIDPRPMFRLRFATLNTNGLRGVFRQPARPSPPAKDS